MQQRSVLRAITRCRTSALGGHLDRCDACGHQAISYNSCRNRHCPKCQAQARERWLHARKRELLDVPYVHVVSNPARRPRAHAPRRGAYDTVAPAPTTTEAPTVDTWACPRCGAAIILGPILSALHLATISLGFDTS